MKKKFLLILLSGCLLWLNSCERCQTMVLCPQMNPTIYKTEGQDIIALYVPNFFSPNGDGVNDHFQVFYKNIKNIECKIYDGTRLVKTINSNYDRWDCKIDGEVHLKVYSLVVKATTIHDENISFTGTLSALGGEFLGDKSQHMEGGAHTIIKHKNIQAPLNNNNGRFDPNLPNGEYIVNAEVNKCGIPKME